MFLTWQITICAFIAYAFLLGFPTFENQFSRDLCTHGLCIHDHPCTHALIHGFLFHYVRLLPASFRPPAFGVGGQGTNVPQKLRAIVSLEIQCVLYLVCFIKGAGCLLSRDLSRSALQIPSVKISNAYDNHLIIKRMRLTAFADAESLGICCYKVPFISFLIWISQWVWIQCPLWLLQRRRRDEEAIFFRMKWSWALSSDSGWKEMNVVTLVLGKGTGLMQ